MDGWMHVIRKRDRLKTKAAKSGKQTDWTNYKHERNKVNNLKKPRKFSLITSKIFFLNLIVPTNEIIGRLYNILLKVIAKLLQYPRYALNLLMAV